MSRKCLEKRALIIHLVKIQYDNEANTSRLLRCSLHLLKSMWGITDALQLTRGFLRNEDNYG